MLNALGATAADAANIWPPRDPVGTGCYGAYCGGGNWGNYGYTQAVPLGGNYGYTQAVPAGGGGPGNSFYYPNDDFTQRPIPLARGL
jgi:hypothetical protein